MATKEMSVGGIFYPTDKKKITDMIEGFFSEVEADEFETPLRAMVCPHAGYIYSGAVAAYGYKTMEKYWDILPKTFVIMVPSHYANFDKVSVGNYYDFQTPLGNIKTDKKLCDRLVNLYPEHFIFHEGSYEKEHSLEVQLPFLKYIGKGDFSILPLLFGAVDIVSVGNILSELSKTKDLFFIVSSDLSHFRDYESAIITDGKTIDSFLGMDYIKITSTANACGMCPWLTLNHIALNFGWSPKLIKYMNSGNTAGGKDKVVGYVSMGYGG